MERDQNRKIDTQFIHKFVALLREYISPIDKKLAYELFCSLEVPLEKCDCYCEPTTDDVWYAKDSF